MPNIRPATAADVKTMAAIEQRCFPPTEAASLAKFTARFAVFPECFFVAEVAGQVAGHINGAIYDQPVLADRLYEEPGLHQPNGCYQMVYGLAVNPDYQRQGLASMLTRHFIAASRAKGHKGMVLTCKDHLVDFYEKLGFVNQGRSASSHGGAEWFDMLLLY